MPKAYKIGNNHEFKVNEFDPDDTSWWKGDKSSAKDETKELKGKLIDLQ